MPFKSKAQQGKICATNKKLCKEFAKGMTKADYKALPKKAAKKKSTKKGK